MSRISLVDSHCHLDFPDFDGERDDVIARALNAGVERMVTICTNLADEPNVRAIAERYAPVYYAAGVHPMQVAKSPTARVEDIVALSTHPKFVGVGETGLDYHYTSESAEAQQESLRVHIEAARQTGLPLIIHSRDADSDMARILSEEHSAGGFECVMHCFSSSANLAQTALELGFYLSISGIATFKKSDALRTIFEAAPLDRLLVETDSPYLAPMPFRGKRNEPAYTANTARFMAEHFGLEEAEFAAQTTRNFNRLFAKAAKASPA